MMRQGMTGKEFSEFRKMLAVANKAQRMIMIVMIKETTDRIEEETKKWKKNKDAIVVADY